MIPAGAACAIAAVAALLLLLGGIVKAKRAARPARRAEAPAPAGRLRWAARPAARAGEAPAASPPSHRGDPRAIYAYAAHVVGQSLAFHGSYRAAAASLRDVPLDWTPPGVRLLLMSNLAQWQLCAGDVEAARQLLPDLCEERAPASVRPLVRGARAAVLVRTGDAEGALALVGRSDGERDEPSEVRQRYRITRAHALAARGELAAARAELRRVVDDVGVDELCRWIPAGGPARATMIELIDAG
ncbi:hypothetical protein [Sorangium cellulosum]|uniref:MalT-like TPR region domain-containing protein n=1 Tax=Sorangium cellulosum So0157-2 TaxID=1254432 RepID=S4YAW1_SORCE|nr:hypothetical protein [Sorangium cellulosum]AGP41440.1 hypothetical protein SCE1572_47315 [Sorangium cellulosum So0157-2]